MKLNDIDQDYSAWLQEQVMLLKARAFNEIDLENLVEELEALVRNEKSAVKSFTYQILLSLAIVG